MTNVLDDPAIPVPVSHPDLGPLFSGPIAPVVVTGPPIPLRVGPSRRDRVALMGTANLSESEWYRIAALPGATYYSGRELPADAFEARMFREHNGVYPDPVFVPAAHHRALETVIAPEVLAPTLTILSGESASVVEPVDPPGLHLLKFQRDAVLRLQRRHRDVVSTKVGAGKTHLAVSAAETIRRRGLIDRVVVMCRRQIVSSVWLKTLHEWGITPIVLSGTPAQRRDLLDRMGDHYRGWLILKHDAFRLDDIYRHARSIFDERTMLIVDEVHHFRSASSLRYKRLRAALAFGNLDYRMFLTGTLIFDTPADIYAPLMLTGFDPWVNYREYKDRYFDIDRVYTARKDPLGKPVVIETRGSLRPAAVPELRSALEWTSFSRSDADLDLELPPLVPVEHLVEATEREATLYRKIVKRLENPPPPEPGETPETNALALTAMERNFVSDPGLVAGSDSKTARVIFGEVAEEMLRSVSPGSKVRALLSYLATFLEEDRSKVLVYTPFEKLLSLVRALGERTDINEEIYDDLRAILPSTVFFDGTMSEREADRAIEKFLTDPYTRIFFSTDAGGEGQNFQDVCSTVVHYDEPYVLGTYEQRVGRARRRGQTKSVTSVHFRLSSQVDWAAAARGKSSKFVDARVKEILAAKTAERDIVLTAGAP